MSITKKTVLKGLIVTTVAVIGLQGMAFASVRTQAAPAAVEEYAAVQASSKGIARDSKAAPAQVAFRTSSGARIKYACDNTGLPCPRG